MSQEKEWHILQRGKNLYTKTEEEEFVSDRDMHDGLGK